VSALGTHRSGIAAGVLALALAIVPGTASGQEVQPDDDEAATSFGVELDVTSRYLWRGYAWGDGAAVQPSAWLTRGPFWVELWSNAEHDSGGSTLGGWKATELDLTIGAEAAWRGVTITPALAVYDYHDDEDSPTTVEVLVELAVPIGRFEVVSSHALDVAEYTGAYYGDLGLAYVHGLGEGSEARATGYVGWASREFTEVYGGVATGGIYLLGATVAVERCWERLPCLRLHGEATRITRPDVAEAAGGRSRWAVGLALGHEF
jgi:hypothetical protein